jgi:hypothetical protein
MLDELFEKISSEVLTEDVKLQMSTLFESALNEAIKAKELHLEEANRSEITEFKEDLTNQIDEYLNYFVEEFVTENEDVIDSNVKVKTAEKVLETFSKIVSEFNVQLSEEKEEESDEIDTLKQENNKLHGKIMEGKKELDLVKKAALIAESCGKLETELEKEKLIENAKTVEYDDIFEGKLGVFVEQIISGRKTTEEPIQKLDEEKSDAPVEKKINDAMASYLKYL